MTTLGIPLLNQHQILTLQLLSLTRQTDKNFEVIILDDSEEQLHKERVALYTKLLPAFKYIHTTTKMSLQEKWVELANLANHSTFLLTAADNYSPPDRVDRANYYLTNKKVDWLDYSNGVFYNLITKQYAEWRRPKERSSGLFMGTQTEHIKSLIPNNQTAGIDGWLKGQIDIKSKVALKNPKGIHTDGANNISLHRRDMYNKAPFHTPQQKLDNILPLDVINYLENFEVK